MFAGTLVAARDSFPSESIVVRRAYFYVYYTLTPRVHDILALRSDVLHKRSFAASANVIYEWQWNFINPRALLQDANKDGRFASATLARSFNFCYPGTSSYSRWEVTGENVVVSDGVCSPHFSVAHVHESTRTQLTSHATVSRPRSSSWYHYSLLVYSGEKRKKGPNKIKWSNKQGEKFTINRGQNVCAQILLQLFFLLPCA